MEVVNKRLFEIERTSFALLNLFQEMSVAMEAGFDRISERINKLELQLTNIEARIDQLETRMDRLETKVENLEIQIFDVRNDLTGQISAIRGNSTASLETIDNRLADLTKELMKVNEVTSYEGIYENTIMINEGMKSISAGKRK